MSICYNTFAVDVQLYAIQIQTIKTTKTKKTKTKQLKEQKNLKAKPKTEKRRTKMMYQNANLHTTNTEVTATTTTGSQFTTTKITVAKFGGSSLCDSTQFKKVKNIIDSQEERSIIVVSAPGKRYSEDIKVTDQLIKCHNLQQQAKNCKEQIKNLYAEIIRLEQGIPSALEIAN